jgi:hypothetical protein
MKIDLSRFLTRNNRLVNLHLFKTFDTSESNVLKVDVTTTGRSGWVASTFKMKQLKGVSIHKLLQSNLKYQSKFKTERRKLGEWEYFT